MNNLLDDEEHEHTARRDREITLGASTVLGIFFGLAILCAIFFGFGYSLGSKHSATPSITANGDSLNARNFASAKPSPGSLLNSVPKSLTPADATPLPMTNVPAPRAAAAGTAAPPEAFEPDEPKPSRTPPPAAPAAAIPITSSSAPAVPPQSLVVQVVALTHQEDAEMVATTLKRRGYAVVIRQDANDKLLHVQVGPFTTRKDAEAMRQKLLADGFNAYIK